MLQAAVIGANGFAGAELVRLLNRHPHFQLRVITSNAETGQAIASLYPALRDVSPSHFSPHDDPTVLECDVAFLAVPHTAGMQHAKRLTDAGVAVIDLSADFRFGADVATYEQTYNVSHKARELTEISAYGQPELNKEALLEQAQNLITKKPVVVGCAGCYPTATILAALPAIKAGLVHNTIISDCLSGISGAGRSPKATNHFCYSAENAEAYGIPAHRHAPEIDMEFQKAFASGKHKGIAPNVLFTPHLTPMVRGMLATVHMPIKNADMAHIRSLYEAEYGNNPFIHVLDEGVTPHTSSVTGTNDAHINIFKRNNDYITAVCAIDNLGKGAAAQAIQCANIIFGLEETAGLKQLGKAL
ncbi:MAG: N-acetyl-gamma-glutamyl-phosphate reductase [Eggerthellaceae bacterium]|nr:N-acetyl-gamma-glutamyl-phosphate reductase [Eggerthellaceae bacterium]